MEEKKFSLPTVFIVLPIIAFGDLLDVAGEVIFLAPIIGQFLFFIAKIFSFMIWLTIQVWFTIKGVRGNAYLAASIADLLGLPFGQTIGFLLTVIITNNPEVSKIARSAKLTSH